MHRHHQDQQRHQNVGYKEGIEKKHRQWQYHHRHKCQNAQRHDGTAGNLAKVIKAQPLKCQFHDLQFL